jgi:HEPN domain-containing protein
VSAARPDTVALLRQGRLQRVPTDRTTARDRLDVAEQHIATARRLLAEGLDLEIAYVALYDAARKAVTAAMLAGGVRAAHRGGAHEAVAIWCAEVLGPGCPPARRFDRLRRRRHRSEYEDLALSGPDVVVDLDDAAAVVAVARRHVEGAPDV